VILVSLKIGFVCTKNTFFQKRSSLISIGFVCSKIWKAGTGPTCLAAERPRPEFSFAFNCRPYEVVKDALQQKYTAPLP
jgi:hypothetical protein